MPSSVSLAAPADALRSEFDKNGFVILPGFVDLVRVSQLRRIAESELAAGRPPVEYESDLHYPGAPASRSAPGGGTIRRLLDAWSRAGEIREWATDTALASCLNRLLGPELVMPRAHHNCIMTKQPRYSSATGWHQDIRYWSFEKPELISAWLALDAETPENGGLWLIPGSHRMAFSEARFDEKKFFRSELTENDEVIRTRVAVRLNPGDVLLFHCMTLHAAQHNSTDKTKYSLVFSYRAADNLPLAGTRSASLSEITL